MKKYHGKTVESILGDYSGLESTRSNDVANQIASLWKQIQNNEYDAVVIAYTDYWKDEVYQFRD